MPVHDGRLQTILHPRLSALVPCIAKFLVAVDLLRDRLAKELRLVQLEILWGQQLDAFLIDILEVILSECPGRRLF
jgi:hypothetical protein